MLFRTRSAISSVAIASVILVIGIAAVAGFYVEYSTSSASIAAVSTTYSTPIILKNSSTAAETGNRNSSLQLVLRTNDSTIRSGQGLNIEYYFANPTSKNITLNSIWKYAMPYETPPCGGLVIPSLYLGVYTKANISQATPLNLWQPNMGTGCPIASSAPSFTFLANSTKLSNSGTDTFMPIYGYLIPAHNCPYYNGTTIYNTEANCWIIQKFPVGTYTIAVGDEWNDLVLLYLTVMQEN
jgi:hypothetical protein